MLFGLFGSGKKKTKYEEYIGDTGPRNWSFLGSDMHSHLVPGIDDGAQTIEDSIELITRLQQAGYKSLITTPHIKAEVYPNDPTTIGEGLNQLRHELHQRGINIPIRAAAEYYIDDTFIRLLKNKELLTVTGNEVLVEISFMLEPLGFHELMFEIQTVGYKPILAHPERYSYYHQKPHTYNELKEKGCLLQLNMLALTGYYGKAVKQAADYMMKERLYDYIGTDMHHVRHAEGVEKFITSSVYDQVRQYPFRNYRLHEHILAG
jgi:protein-tyrosine phosphatase